MSAGNSWNLKPDQKDQVRLIYMHDLTHGFTHVCCFFASGCVKLTVNCPWARGKSNVAFLVNLPSSVTGQARKVRSGNTLYHWAILSLYSGLSRCRYISALFAVANVCIMSEHIALGGLKTSIIHLYSGVYLSNHVHVSYVKRVSKLSLHSLHYKIT